jgi:ferrous iron transport protein A
MVTALAVEPGLRHRLEALGIKPGQQLKVLRRGWWSGPIHLRVGMTELMLRRIDAARIQVFSADPGRVAR